MRTKILIAITLSVAPITGLNAEIRLPSVISDNMVLQQQSDVNLRGKATPGSRVEVTPSWDGRMMETIAGTDSTWKVTVHTPEAGGPYSILFSERENEISVSNVLCGEVWLCSGQSNMEMPMKGFGSQPVAGAADIIVRAKKTTPVRMFITDSENGRWVRQYSRTPKDDMRGRWHENTPESVAETSAAAYYFARYIQDILDVPVGIMISSLGGSAIEPWIPEDIITDKFPQINAARHEEGSLKMQQTEPGVLWNAKINPLTDYAIRGCIWYQGESNRHEPTVYADLLTAFAEALRNGFGNSSMPFYYVEIAPYVYDGPEKLTAALLREGQADALDMIPGSGMASTIDIGNPACIHPADKATVGQRLAWLALSDTYGIKCLAPRSPRYKSHEVTGNKVYINVSDAPGGLNPIGKPLPGFEIAGSDGIFHPAKAEIESPSRRLVVTCDAVSEPRDVRYAFSNCPEAGVFGTSGLPLLPFRTRR